MKVAKFGGSSLASASQIKKVFDIVQADKQRKFIVAIMGFNVSEILTDIRCFLRECFITYRTNDEI